VLTNQLDYWRTQLAGELPVLDWPWDRHRPATQSYRGALQPFHLASDLTNALKKLSHREGVTLFVTLAGFAALLHRYTGQ